MSNVLSVKTSIVSGYGTVTEFEPLSTEADMSGIWTYVHVTTDWQSGRTI